MIYSWAKSLGVTPEHVLFEMSYKNLLLYGAAIPQYDDEEEKEWDPKLDANNPDNFKQGNDTDLAADEDNDEYDEEDEEFIKEY